jgi:threonine synthase
VVALRDSGGRALTFQDTTLVQAVRELAREGLWQEHSGVAGLAALREAKDRGETIEEPVVAVLTSSGLKDVPATPVTPSAGDGATLDRVIASLNKV